MKSLEEYSFNAEGLCSSDLNLLNLIFKDCPEGIVYKDKNMKYKSMNDAFCKIFQIKDPQSFIGKSQADFLSESNKILVNSVNKEVQNEKQAINFIMNLDIDGKENKILNITSAPIFKDNDFLGIISITKDITQEESIKEKFVLKHFQLKLLLENIPMLIYMQDTNLNYIAGTKPTKNFVKEGYDAFSNIHINRDKTILEEENEAISAIKNNKTIIKEKEVTDFKEASHWYKVYKVPINDIKGNVTGLITLANNIDAEKQLQNQRETFVASLGHDLKNPTLAQIRGLELLLKGNFGEITKEQRELLEMVLDSCRYMNGMLSSLLATYRNYEGSLNFSFEDFNMKDLIMECVSEMIYVAKDKNVNIIIEDLMSNYTVQGDRVQIKRVVMNLLSNGIKYAFKDTDLNLLIKSENNTINFEFKNESPYISEEKQKTIFAQYVSYASAHKELGVGLGLYASKKIIDGHNGELYVKSYKNNHNIFGFKIPARQNFESLDIAVNH